MRRSSSVAKFVVCIRNEDCEDFELRKLYRVLPDKTAAADGFIGMIDELSEDYLYPQDIFFRSNALMLLQKLNCRQLIRPLTTSAWSGLAWSGLLVKFCG